MASPPVVRRWIMTGAITAITVTGAIYGADLKSRQEYKQVRYLLLILITAERSITTCSRA